MECESYEQASEREREREKKFFFWSALLPSGLGQWLEQLPVPGGCGIACLRLPGRPPRLLPPPPARLQVASCAGAQPRPAPGPLTETPTVSRWPPTSAVRGAEIIAGDAAGEAERERHGRSGKEGKPSEGQRWVGELCQEQSQGF